MQRAVFAFVWRGDWAQFEFLVLMARKNAEQRRKPESADWQLEDCGTIWDITTTNNLVAGQHRRYELTVPIEWDHNIVRKCVTRWNRSHHLTRYGGFFPLQQQIRENAKLKPRPEIIKKWLEYPQPALRLKQRCHTWRYCSKEKEDENNNSN